MAILATWFIVMALVNRAHADDRVVEEQMPDDDEPGSARAKPPSKADAEVPPRPAPWPRWKSETFRPLPRPAPHPERFVVQGPRGPHDFLLSGRFGAALFWQQYRDIDGTQLAYGPALNGSLAIGKGITKEWTLYVEGFAGVTPDIYGGGRFAPPPMSYRGVDPGVRYLWPSSGIQLAGGVAYYEVAKTLI